MTVIRRTTVWCEAYDCTSFIHTDSPTVKGARQYAREGCGWTTFSDQHDLCPHCAGQYKTSRERWDAIQSR
jgi:hypothetical protein